MWWRLKMPLSLKSLCGRSLLSLLLLLALTLPLSNCGTLPLGLGGGPNVAANTQLGKENNQIAFQRKAEAGRDVVTKRSEVESGFVESITIQNIPPLALILLIAGWLAPSPGEIGRGLSNLIRGRRNV